jgi:hypothetical protein
MKIDNGFGSHKFVLEHMINILENKTVLELGSGDYSTKLIHDIVGGVNGKIITIDTDSNWLNRYMDLKNDNHDLIHYDIDKLHEFFDNDTNDWGLVFVDSGTWDSRVMAMEKYAKTADYIILHDCDYFPNYNIIGKTIKPVNINEKDMGIRDYGTDMFKNWVEFSLDDWFTYGSWMPPTLVGSNKHNLDNLKIDNMIITNKSK